MDKIVILFLFGILLFASPLVYWWASPAFPWYAPYLLWAILIGLIVLVQRHHEH
ncbi:MAG: hypothetical protein KJZ96_05590 [Rhodocyclaceae bacterium]|jgi:hypothetical protein|nr:hypothetical protein [Rhodocyclaceae bacterium]MCL4757799.1 hypothetical protein [Rhodocyclaceae bacterium]